VNASKVAGNDKPGNFAGIGEYGCHGLMITAMGIANVVVKRAVLVPLGSQQPAGNRDDISAMTLLRRCG
jgi:hypothetical protein